MEIRHYKSYLMILILETYFYPFFKFFVYFSYGPVEPWYFRFPNLVVGTILLLSLKFYPSLKKYISLYMLIASSIMVTEFLYLVNYFFSTPYGNYYFIGSFIVIICSLISFRNKKHFIIYYIFSSIIYMIYLRHAYLYVSIHKNINIIEIYNQMIFVFFTYFLILIQVFANIKSDEDLDKAKRELEEKQQQLINSSKLASLGEMAGGIAHEINNPLQIISGNIELLELKHEKDEELSEIKSTVSRINKIIEGLRTFSRDEKLSKIEEVKLIDIINDTLSFCKEKFKNKGILIEINIDSQTTINCNYIEMSRVFLNLLNNSFDAILEESYGVKKSIYICSEIMDKTLFIKFYDSGKKITKEVNEKIFTPFFTTKSLGKGTGIGLSLSKGIVEKHGGKLYLNPEPKSFIIEFPVN